eukprot:GHRQ01022404.1.p2 GENE.GHRQ01022404.1~~GHRQ01022404.1.p2  ORF type:complete len:132 (+),score=31.68 GHRQ01022404.1:1-396(+)
MYDALQQVEVVHRANGQGDRYCMSIHPRTNTPCTHLVVSGQRYLIFPELKQCCKCCSSAGGCGILAPTWLDAAEYTGQVHESRFGPVCTGQVCATTVEQVTHWSAGPLSAVLLPKSRRCRCCQLLSALALR